MEKLIKVLKNSGVNDYRILETNSQSSELFYVGKKLETNRATNLKKVDVTIYVDVDDKRGSATFVYNNFLSEEELSKLIEEKIYAAKFALNKYYEIPGKNLHQHAADGNQVSHGETPFARDLPGQQSQRD